MEDFIKDIYWHSFIISNLKEFIFLLNSGRPSQARDLYNKTALELEKWLGETASSDPSTASHIQDIAIKIKNCYEDYCQCKGIVEHQLITALYKSISNYNTINVSEGKYSLISSDTGFLTLKDEDLGIYLHDIHDPMYEAYQIVSTIYKPEMESFMLLGCGLGYEAYQIYHQSNGAIMIYLFEEDENILNYATLYGVLSLIPDENIDIIHISDREKLAGRYIQSINSHPSCGYHVSAFKKSLYNGVCDNELNRIIINHEYSFESYNTAIINHWRNRRLNRITFTQAAEQNKYNEYVVISAGPSLDHNLNFLKQCKGKIGLIAVNTVVRRLLNEEITPDVIAAADPSQILSDHINGLEDDTKKITLIADWVLSWKYASMFRGDICFVRTNASAELTKLTEPDEPVWDISGTVACLAIEAAVRFGGSRIYLVGQDLAYPSGQKYARGMPHGEVSVQKWDMQVPSVDGSMVDTCEAFDWFRKAIEYQIAKYDQVEFINMSKHGANIKGAANLIYT